MQPACARADVVFWINKDACGVNPHHYILLDFGSTFTKLTVADASLRQVVHTDRVPSTVRTDARICLEQCFDSARAALGSVAFDRAKKLSASSAAGGLRMAVVGLSRTLSVTAARNAAFGAGAKIIGSFTGELTDSDTKELQNLDVEILLFCGGYENGSSRALEHNAQKLAASKIGAPVVFAGNSKMAEMVRSDLVRNGKICYVVPNIIPQVGVLNTGPTEEIIRHVFMRTIVNMKGLGQVQELLDTPLAPTPSAVLSAGELYSLGTETQKGVGALMVVDIGGATTDIHSFIEHAPYEGARLMGSPEPYARRTVEGDMGMRESSISLAEEIGWDKMAKAAGVDVETMKRSINKRVDAVDYVPEDEREKKIDHAIASGAVHVSARRHSGRIKYVHASNCPTAQYGKNTSRVTRVIGTGGPLVNSGNPGEILRNVCRRTAADAEILLPETAEFYLDAKYTLYASGLLRPYDADLAFALVTNSLTRI